MTARACLPDPPCDCLIDSVLVAGRFLPVLDEGGVEITIQSARRIVGDVEPSVVCAYAAGLGRGKPDERPERQGATP